MNPKPVIDSKTISVLDSIVNNEWRDIPEQFKGTGAPGKYLEHLFGVDGGNEDTPDAGRWELKFHGGKSLITLFHKESEPQGSLDNLVYNYGWRRKGLLNFRHTIRGGKPPSKHGFLVTNKEGKIFAENIKPSNQETPYWTHDTIINGFVGKLRRLLVVSGKKVGRNLKFTHADFFWEPQTVDLIEAVENGIIAIDFDARENPHSASIRNHGTKFRISYKDLPLIYHRHKKHGDE